MREQLPQAPPEYFDWLASLDCSKVRVYGIKDGRLVFPREPMVRLEGPLSILQLLETPILNLINFASLVCTNGARMRWTAGQNTRCVEFGLRRAQGPNGGLTATKYSYLGGFEGTSNVEGGFQYGVPIVGTHAHSFVMSYEKEEDLGDNRYLNGVDILVKATENLQRLGWTKTQRTELYAFVAYASAFPNNFIALVDSYSTLESGVRNFIAVYLALHSIGYDGKQEGKSSYGVRLDSGDLAALSIESKKLFAHAGEVFGWDLSHLKVLASNDINEATIKKLLSQGHQIDVFGIGTNLVTCQAQPALGMVYKLVEIKGAPKIKLSDEPEKTTLPGDKMVLRVYTAADDKPSFDLLCLATEASALQANDKPLTVYEVFGKEPKYFVAGRVENLSELLFSEGKVTQQLGKLSERRSACLKEFELFGGAEFLLKEDDMEYPVYLSERLNTLANQLLEKYHQ
jgi:nicotinate phosphoribosyltransferase